MKKDGGPAFPNESDFGVSDKSCGMSLRDYFAAHAPIPAKAGATWGEHAQLRWEYADAMLAERDK